MSLAIETFTNRPWRPGGNVGGSTLFKALGHPLAVPKARALLKRLRAAGPVAVYDPLGHAEGVDALHDLRGLDLAGVYVQRLEEVGGTVLGAETEAVTALSSSKAAAVLVAAFDAGRLIDQIRHLLPEGAEVLSLDEMRLPDDMLTKPRDYLAPLNFATNFAFLRDESGHHTRLVSANYWGGHGAEAPELWLCLFDAQGAVLAEWRQALPAAGGSLAIDSAEVRQRFGLGDFTGSLFVHALRIAGHDVVKYALDTYGDSADVLSCTHDANAWPADLYAGLPAPDEGERVVLWIQNSHPLPIPPGGVGLNLMGSQEVRWFREEVPAFGTRALDVAELLPGARWPQQIEVQAGRYFVRPRYEVIAEGGRRRMAHANVERTDLVPDPEIPKLEPSMGKGYIMPLPVLPVDAFSTAALPTPMATSQAELPLSVLLIDASGVEVARRYLGRIPRRTSALVDVDAWLAEEGLELASGSGHLEFVYDFREGGAADGWLHAIGRYSQRMSGHKAETSFGAHIFNTALVYRDEPQSYVARPPGLSTRLFLRLGAGDLETLCHLIYPASTPWHPTSTTRLILHDGAGAEVASAELAIPCGGSRHCRYREVFEESARKKAGEGAYIIVRDLTCRLFGYHGLLRGDQAFCLDHMFGF
jgi:hypothetical protein